MRFFFFLSHKNTVVIQRKIIFLPQKYNYYLGKIGFFFPQKYNYYSEKNEIFLLQKYSSHPGKNGIFSPSKIQFLSREKWEFSPSKIQLLPMEKRIFFPSGIIYNLLFSQEKNRIFSLKPSQPSLQEFPISPLNTEFYFYFFLILIFLLPFVHNTNLTIHCINPSICITYPKFYINIKNIPKSMDLNTSSIPAGNFLFLIFFFNSHFWSSSQLLLNC